MKRWFLGETEFLDSLRKSHLFRKCFYVLHLESKRRILLDEVLSLFREWLYTSTYKQSNHTWPTHFKLFNKITISFVVTTYFPIKRTHEIERSIFTMWFFCISFRFSEKKRERVEGARSVWIFTFLSFKLSRLSAEVRPQICRTVQIRLGRHSRWLHPSSLGNVAEIMNLCVTEEML